MFGFPLIAMALVAFVARRKGKSVTLLLGVAFMLSLGLGATVALSVAGTTGWAVWLFALWAPSFVVVTIVGVFSGVTAEAFVRNRRDGGTLEQ